MSDQQIFQLLHTYLQGKCTPDELQTALDLLHTQQGKACWKKLLDKQATQTQEKNIPTIDTGVSRRIWQKLDAAIGTEPEAISLPSRRHNWFSAAHLAVACSILLLVTIAWQWQVWHQSVQHFHIQTAFGEKKRIGLPDGSVIILNGNSTIDAHFPNNTKLPREIHLAGEAFFNVAKQANHQVFKVITKDSCVVEVLGTEFNINQRNSGTKIILETGKIALTVPQANQPKKMLLQPQDVAIISAQHKSVEVQKINPRLLTSWRDNQLFLENTPISAIADMLKETYNITLTFPNKNLAKERITGTIASGNVDELLQAIGYVLKLNVIKNGNVAHFEEVR